MMQKSKVAKGIIEELSSSFPPYLQCYRKRDTVLEYLNYTMRIVQPAIKSVCLKKQERITLEDTILIMIEQGFRLTNEAQAINIGIVNFKPIFEPEFEKLFIYGVKFFFLV